MTVPRTCVLGSVNMNDAWKCICSGGKEDRLKRPPPFLLKLPLNFRAYEWTQNDPKMKCQILNRPDLFKKSERNCLREHPIESEQVQVFAWCEISNLDESKSAGWLRSKRKKRAPDCVKNVKLYGTKENDLRVCCHFDSTASQFLLIRSECARILNILAENSKHLDT